MEPENQREESKPSVFEQRVKEYGQAVNQGRDQDAEGLMVELFTSVAAEAFANPSPESVWLEMADQCEQLGNWGAAEDARRKALDLAREHPNRAYPVKFHLDLGSLYEILGRKEEALAEIKTALELAGESEIPTLIGMALEANYNTELGQRNLQGIRAAAKQALEATPGDRIYNTVKLRFLLLQARCAAGLGEFEAAESCVAAARKLAGDGQQSALISGYPFFRARAAEVAAKIHAACGDFQEAVAAFAEVVTREREVCAKPHLQGIRSRYRLAQALFTLADYLEKSAKPADATVARTEARDILGELKLPPIPPKG
ncbi:MAG TPA: hypothetical protein VGR78_05670 [Verrucomicrobiae bacterium]|jgi:tetratricopeptide (TPR) repeat protein|nr:hypothetical protein [Verrucomicrobiae bacterium]